MNKQKHMMSGFSSVFSFTLKNQMRGKGFIVATFIMPIVFFLIFAGINVGVAAFNKPEEKDPVNIDVLFIVDETEYKAFGDLFVYAAEDEALKNVKMVVKNNSTVKDVAKAIAADDTYKDKEWGILSLKLKQGVMSEREDGTSFLDKDAKCLVVTLSTPEDSNINGDTSDLVLGLGQTVASMVTISAAQVTTEQYTLLNSNFTSQVIDAGEKENNFIVEMMVTIMPMLVVMIMYIMILMYCQGMGKVVVSEKSSKLMEMMLTSVQPMALISGKVFALIAIALMQFFLWIASGVIGFVVGDIVAKAINPDYTNVIMMVIDLIREYGMSAFSVPGVIFALLAIVFGFAQYCMISALVASTCAKAEEVAERQGVYMLVIIAGYMFSFIASTNDDMRLICDLIPISAAFRLPCDALLGAVPIWVSAVSVSLMIVITVVFAYLAGKVYHAQVFLRGQSMSDQMKKLVGFLSKGKKKTENQ